MPQQRKEVGESPAFPDRGTGQLCDYSVPQHSGPTRPALREDVQWSERSGNSLKMEVYLTAPKATGKRFISGSQVCAGRQRCLSGGCKGDVRLWQEFALLMMRKRSLLTILTFRRPRWGRPHWSSCSVSPDFYPVTGSPPCDSRVNPDWFQPWLSHRHLGF